MRRRLLLLAAALIPVSRAVTCYDCVGQDCMGNFCQGDYCVLSQFRPRWGSIEFGKPRVVKGCMTGTLLRKDVKSHCEVAEDDEEEIFTCFCKGKDNCNGGRAVAKLETEPVQIVRCQCTGEHCDGSKTCFGELCSYVYNHKTKETERGCVNASIPLVERRSVGSCMSPPITGAMHHSIAMKPEDLLMTESCVCGQDFCNTEKPKTTVPERMTCPAGVSVNIKGSKKQSSNTTCDGEFCFKVDIKSKLGFMKEYTAQGCASFTGDDDLAEELNPTGCAKFESEQLFVKACYRTDDEDAAGRARAKQKVRDSKKGKGKGKKPSKWQEEEENEDEDEEQDEADLAKKEKVEEKEGDEPKQEKETKKEDEEEEEEEATPKSFIFEEPTEAPIPDESNTTMITVFILIMLCIVVSGAVWKFELHKKLFRSSYDTVAGG